jgi:hypothetical protein
MASHQASVTAKEEANIGEPRAQRRQLPSVSGESGISADRGRWESSGSTLLLGSIQDGGTG